MALSTRTAFRQAASGNEHEADAALVQRAKSGDAEAWSQIYDLYHRPLFRYFLARTGDTGASEDLAASVFLEAVKGIASYSHQGRPLLAWLYRIARNAVADHYRRTLGRTRPAGSPSRIPWLSRRATDPLPERELAAPLEMDGGISPENLDLRRAIANLGEAQREIIALHYFGGFTLREVAGILGVNERVVYSMQAKALAQLRERLQT